jgi:hypothetical protein
MRVHLAVLFALSATCPTAQHCYWVTEPAPTNASASASAAAAVSSSTSFCRGWEDGWSQGWKDVKGQASTPPSPPSCPQAECGRETYEDEYSRGHIAGGESAKRVPRP